MTHCLGLRPAFAELHYDWTLIKRGEDAGYGMAPIIMLRHPVERAVSHFYYDRKMNYSMGWEMRNQTIGQYFSDFSSMMDTKLIWFDGQVRKDLCVRKIFCQVQSNT